MGLKNLVKKGVSIGFQPKRWLGFDHVKSNGKICLDLMSDLLSTDKQRKISEDQIVAEKELQADVKALKSRKLLALALTLFYLLSGLSMVGYAFYLWFSKDLILQGGVSFVIALLIFLYSLREFMVYMKIRHGKIRQLSFKRLFAPMQKHDADSEKP